MAKKRRKKRSYKNGAEQPARQTAGENNNYDIPLDTKELVFYDPLTKTEYRAELPIAQEKSTDAGSDLQSDAQSSIHSIEDNEPHTSQDLGQSIEIDTDAPLFADFEAMIDGNAPLFTDPDDISQSQSVDTSAPLFADFEEEEPIFVDDDKSVNDYYSAAELFREDDARLPLGAEADSVRDEYAAQPSVHINESDAYNFSAEENAGMADAAESDAANTESTSDAEVFDNEAPSTEAPSIENTDDEYYNESEVSREIDALLSYERAEEESGAVMSVSSEKKEKTGRFFKKNKKKSKRSKKKEKAEEAALDAVVAKYESDEAEELDFVLEEYENDTAEVLGEVLAEVKSDAQSEPRAVAADVSSLRELAEKATEYDFRTDEEYKKKLEEIQAWEERFFARVYRFLSVLLIVLIAGTAMLKAEIGRISIDGRDSYELGINMFGVVSTVYDNGAAATVMGVPVAPGSVKTVVYRIIDDMYNRPDESTPYGDGEPILMGFYRAEWAKRFFEKHDFSHGKANMQLRTATKNDRKNAKLYAVSIGRAVLIREYTEKYGGDESSNFEALRRSKIIEIIDRDAVTDKAAAAVDDLFSGSSLESGNDIPMIITENEAEPPAPAVEPVPEPEPVATEPPAAAAPTVKRNTSTAKRASKSTSKSTSKSSSSSYNSTASEATAEHTSDTPPQPASQPSVQSVPAATEKPAPVKTVQPVHEASRPTANPSN